MPDPFGSTGVPITVYVDAGVPVTLLNANVYPFFRPAPNCVSIRHALVESGGAQVVPASAPNVEAYPTVGYAELNEICAVFTVRSEATAADSLAAMRDRR